MAERRYTNNSNGLTKYRLEQLEKKVDELAVILNKIMTNHLPHLQEDALALKTRINIMTAVNIGGIVLGIVIAKVLK